MSTHTHFTLQNLSIEYPGKVCFSGFSATVHDGQRITLVGDNGSGKSTLLKILAGILPSTQGSFVCAEGLTIGYLPQDMSFDDNKTVDEAVKEHVQPILAELKRFEELAARYGQTPTDDQAYADLLEHLTTIDAFSLEHNIDVLCTKLGLQSYRHKKVATLSGGQQMHLGLARILASQPQVLLLDEPTNHLDRGNRQLLLDFLQQWPGTAVIATHDLELLQQWPQHIWHFEQGRIATFAGSYAAFAQELQQQEAHILTQREQLLSERRDLQKSWQNEQQRAAKSRRSGMKKYADNKIARNAAKQRGEHTHGRNKLRLREDQQEVQEKLKNLQLKPQIVPKFNVNAGILNKGHIVIEEGKVRYGPDLILQGLNLCVRPRDRLAIVGPNGCGKSTLIKAIADHTEITRVGD